MYSVLMKVVTWDHSLQLDIEIIFIVGNGVVGIEVDHLKPSKYHGDSHCR